MGPRRGTFVGRIELATGLRSVGNHAFHGRHGYEIVEGLAKTR